MLSEIGRYGIEGKHHLFERRVDEFESRTGFQEGIGIQIRDTSHKIFAVCRRAVDSKSWLTARTSKKRG